MATRLRPMAELNQLGSCEFGEALRPLFEAAGPLAEALQAQRPFASYADLIERGEAVAVGLSRAQQISVLNGHPRIGESGRVVKQTSDLSYREQAYDAETNLAPDALRGVYAELARLNRAYERRFGFRFVVFVNGRAKSELVPVLQERLHHSPEEELRAGLQAIFAIARDRLRTLAE
ncbi:MAG: 2-oxo-4-hydroxy-4-carboxy-5-ureidoimidazoline decarboxylase [Chloroflexota bacterium]